MNRVSINNIANSTVVIVVITMFGMMISMALGIWYGKNITQDCAIAAGVARWTVNPTNGETAFEFIKP